MTTPAKWGRLAQPVFPMDNVARAFWQSRSGMIDAPELTNLAALASAIRTPAKTEDTTP